MKVLLRAFLLFIAFLLVLSIAKFFFIKLIVLAFWVTGIVAAIYLLSMLFKKPA